MSTSTGVRASSASSIFALDAVLTPPQDRLVDALFDGNLLLGRFLRVDALAAGPALCARVLEMFDEARQRVGTTIEDEIVAHLPHLGFDLEVRHDLFGMDERAVEAGLHAVVEEYRVEHRARVGAQAERNVRDPQRRQRSGQLAFDRANAFDRRHRRIGELGIAGRQA